MLETWKCDEKSQPCYYYKDFKEYLFKSGKLIGRVVIYKTELYVVHSVDYISNMPVVELLREDYLIIPLEDIKLLESINVAS